jgi:3-oxoacyl-(acyl-carrier-protein) synthase
LESARARGAEILAEIVGYGASTDSHHLTQPHPEGDAALRSMEAACREAGLRPSDLDYLNSHGTGTPLNDIAEGRAIQRWAGGDVEKIRVSSTKASIGHLLGGAGAVETVIALMALRENFLPPTTTVETLDEVCTFDLVREPRDTDVRRVLTNSFGFGGANATLILSEFDETRTVSVPSAKAKPFPVRVTGWGAVTPAGWGMPALMSALVIPSETLGEPEVFTREGRDSPSPVRRVPRPAEKLPFLRDPRMRRCSPVGRYSVGAALEAIGEDRLDAIRNGKTRLGVVFCYANGCVNYSSRFYRETLDDPSLASPIVFPETVYNAPASHLSALLGSHGINYTIVGDSAQFLNGLEIGARWLEEDRCDGVVVVGGEEFDWLCIEAFQMFASDTVFAEGAGALYLEKENGVGVALRNLVGPELYTNRVDRSEAARRVASEVIKQGMVSDSTLLTRGSGDPRTDHSETEAWREHGGKRLALNRILGESMGAAVAWQCVLAAEMASRDGEPVIVSGVGENEQAGAAIFDGD